MQHGGLAVETAASQFVQCKRNGEQAAAKVAKSGIRTHDPVHGRPLPAEPTTHAVSVSGSNAQSTAVGWEARGQTAGQAAQDGRRPLKISWK